MQTGVAQFDVVSDDILCYALKALAADHLFLFLCKSFTFSGSMSVRYFDDSVVLSLE